MRESTRKALTLLAAALLAFMSVGCAITDYDGIPGHKTTGDSKLLGQEISFTNTGDPTLDGTYSYVVRYDNTASGTVTIDSLRNAVPSSFTRDGLINQDGNDVQGGGGVLGGKFLPQFVAVDSNKGVCGFGDNLTQDKSASGAAIFFCVSGALEENDRDAELHASFASLDDLIQGIWNGAVSGQFTLEVNGVSINGVTHPVDVLSVGAIAGNLRPSRFSVDLSQPATASLVQTLLDNTSHLQPVSLGLSFNGGMSIELPTNVTVAFNHDVLWSLLS